MRIPGTLLAAVLLIAPLAVAAAPAGAQTISGTVRSGGKPVVGAMVRLLELDRSNRTGARGGFRFTDVPPGTYRLFVGIMGYAAVTDTVRVTAGAPTTVEFALKQTAIPLEQIVVSASPTARPADEEYQSAESKSRLTFDNSGGMTFAQKLSDLPGVAVRSNGAAPSRPILRGLGDNEVLVLQDGLRMGDIATYDPAHATPIDAMSIAQVDVVRGPAAVLYGPNTLGGLVNMITNLVPTPSDHPMSGTISVEGNTVNDEYSGYINNVYTNGGSALRVSGGSLHAGNTAIPKGIYTDPGTGAQFALTHIPQSDDRSAAGGAGYSYQGDFGLVGIGANHYESNYGIPGVPANPNWLTVPPTTSRISQQRNTVEARALLNAGGSWLQRVKFDASYNNYNHSEFPTAQDASGVSDPQANHFHKTDFNAMLQLQQREAGRLTGTVGFWTDVQGLTISGDQPLGPNSTTNDVAAFAYEEYRASHDTRFQVGARVDYNGIHTHPYPQSTDSVFRTSNESRNHTAFTGSLGAVQQLTPDLIASLSIARSFRAPTVQELFANGLDAPSGTYSIGSADLQPEQGVGVDASLKGDFANATFELSPYVNVIDHYIYAFLRGDTIQDFPVRQFSSTRARLAGFEAVATVEPAPHWALRASSDYVNGQDTQTNAPLPFMPPLRGLLRATYQTTRYNGIIEWTGAAAQNRLGPGDTPTAGYALLNLGIGMRIVHGGTVSEINLRCNNVFDRVYRNNLSVIKDFLPQPGRGFQLNYELLY